MAPSPSSNQKVVEEGSRVATAGGGGDGGKGGGAAGMSGQHARPAMMKRQSSASSSHSQSSNKQGNITITSPSSGGGEHHPLRQHISSKPVRRNIVLPRNHSSRRNLAKLNRQMQAQALAQEERKHSRQRSHEGDTEIRLPGSLDESRPSIKRNLTAYQLPRNTSHAKLKKNLSHGQLTRLGSGRNLAGMNLTAHAHAHISAQRAPPSPGLQGKSKRPKSAEVTGVEKELLERECERYRRIQEEKQRKGSRKRVGFAVGSSGDNSDDAGSPQMEGSGLQEDEWTEESASTSPYSTRQNTANNSRRTSMNMGRAVDKMTPSHFLATKVSEGVQKQKAAQEQAAQASVESGSEDGSESNPPSPRHIDRPRTHAAPEQLLQHDTTRQSAASDRASLVMPAPGPSSNVSYAREFSEAPKKPNSSAEPPAQPVFQVSAQDSNTLRSPFHKAKDYMVQDVESAAKDYANPAAQRALSRSQQLPGPVVSNVSVSIRHSNQDPLGTSVQSAIEDDVADVEQDELVSRFMPSASHPSIGSGTNTAFNTPKTSGFHTPEGGHSFSSHHRSRTGFQVGPVSPGSTFSGSSGATTPAIGRSRTELRLMQEKALADLESRADQKPFLPGHVYDRRNESLKSFMSTTTLVDGKGTSTSGLSMGPQIFQGRFRAVNTELRVVQKYRDPIGEAIARLKACKGSKLNQRSSAPPRSSTGGLPTSKSAVSLPSQKAASLSKSASPPKSSPLKRQMQSTVQLTGGSERQKNVRGVSFAERAPDTREIPHKGNAVTPAEIVRRLWDEL